MEELIAVGLQLFFEVGIAMLGAPGLDATCSREGRNGCGWFLAHALVGGGLGFLSTLIFPNLILPNLGLRIAYLVLAPLAAGGLAAGLASWLKPKGKFKTDPGDAFLHAMLFAGMFGAARFAFAIR